MAKKFLVDSSNPPAILSQLQQWASAKGLQLTGTAAAGDFHGKASGLVGALVGEIVGSYSVSGKHVTITLDKHVPTEEVARGLSQFGLQLIDSE